MEFVETREVPRHVRLRSMVKHCQFPTQEVWMVLWHWRITVGGSVPSPKTFVALVVTASNTWPHM